MRRKRWIWFPLVFLAALAAAFSWYRFISTSDGSLSRIRREGVLRIGYAIEAPYAFQRADGTPTGLEIEVAKRIAERLAIPRIEWIQSEFGSLLFDLEAGRFDVIAAGMFITPERARQADFSEPTFRVRQALLVRAGNPEGLHSYEEIRGKPGARIAVLLGSIEEAMLRRAGVPESRILRVPDALTGRIAVETGLAEGLALSSPTIRVMARQRALGRTEAAEPFAQPPPDGGSLPGFGAVVFRKTDDALRKAWNRELRGFVGGAEHRRLLAEFGLTDRELPGSVTLDAVLAGRTP